MVVTSFTRVNHNKSFLRYPSDLTGQEWSLIKPLDPRRRAGRFGGG